jgi:SM-20-related protein
MLNQEKMLKDLMNQGWFYQENVFNLDFVKKINEEMRNKSLTQATIGKNKKLNTEIRSDFICWLDHQNCDGFEKKYFDFVKNIKDLLNKEFYLGLNDFEGHFAQYPEGSFYKQHMDNFQGGNKRVVTVICYLNEGWKEEDGGKLRLLLDNKLDVNPLPGSIVCFMSKEILHEVLPANKERKAITGWILRNDEII